LGNQLTKVDYATILAYKDADGYETYDDVYGVEDGKRNMT
jgi:hypothetical protein